MLKEELLKIDTEISYLAAKAAVYSEIIEKAEKGDSDDNTN